MTLKFFLRIRIDSNQIESNANSNRIESNPVFLSSNRIELKLERIESNRITLKFDSIRFIRNLTNNTQLIPIDNHIISNTPALTNNQLIQSILTTSPLQNILL